MKNSIENINKAIQYYRETVLPNIDSELKKEIDNDLIINANYETNKIEGNNATLGQTISILKGESVEELIPRDVNDIKGQAGAYLCLFEIAKREDFITLVEIRELHKTLLVDDYYGNGIDQYGNIVPSRIHTGVYKTKNNHVMLQDGTIFKYAEWTDVEYQMRDWYDYLIKQVESIAEITNSSLMLLLAEVHYKFIIIHPFEDGNGRMCRMMLNYILLKLNLPLLVFKNESKSEYFKALQIADADKNEKTRYNDLMYFIADQYQKVFRYIELRYRGEYIEFGADEKEFAECRANLVIKEAKGIKGFVPVIGNDEQKNNFLRTFIDCFLVELVNLCKKYEDLFISYTDQLNIHIQHGQSGGSRGFNDLNPMNLENLLAHYEGDYTEWGYQIEKLNSFSYQIHFVKFRDPKNEYSIGLGIDISFKDLSIKFNVSVSEFDFNTINENYNYTDDFSKIDFKKMVYNIYDQITSYIESKIKK